MRATVEDAELCFGIARAAAIAGFQHVFPPDVYAFPDDAIRADWVSALTDPDGETYIAFEDDEAVGVVSVGHGVVQTLYVMPEFWSRGIGGVLHDHALDRLREVNVQEARLWTLTENHRARAFYEKRGWSLTGRTRVVPYPPHPIDVEYARSTLRSTVLRGRCACRAVTYEVSDEFVVAYNCHCSNCRARTGSAFSTWGEIEPEKLRVTKGEESLIVTGDPHGHHGKRCGTCFSLLYWTGYEGKIRVPYGSLIDEPTLKPMAHMFVGSKAPWYEILDDLPQHDEYPWPDD